MPSIELRRALAPFSALLAIVVCATPYVGSVANTAPTISGSPLKSVAAGNACFFERTAKDSNDVSTAWASTSGNSAPKISGMPASTAVVGQAYSFRPTTSDANGDRLKYTVKNKPGWAAFSPSTGRLSGTPSSSSVGAFTNILITASDGKVSSSLPAFTINVAAAPKGGEVGLSWSAPTRSTDGALVNNLSGYRVYYGQSSSSYSYTLSLPSPSLTSVVIENLATGKWYFAVRALTSDGQEGELSMQGSKYVE